VNLKTLSIAALVLLAVAGLGALARHMGGGKSEATGRAGSTLLRPSDLDQATAIRIATGSATSTLQVVDDRWVVKEQFGFAVNRDNLSNFLFKLAELKFDRFISKDAESYPGMGVLLPSENGGKVETDKTGIEFAVLDAQGGARLHYVFGSRRRGDATGEGPAGGMYVRDMGGGAVYLISGSPRILTKPEEWIHNVILNLDEKKDIKSFSLRQPGQPDAVLHRVGEPPEKTDFETKVDWTMDNAPANRKVSARAVGELAKGIGDLFMAHVADPKLTSAQMHRSELAILSVELFDGRRHLLTFGSKDDKEGFRYMTAEASLDPKVTDQKVKKEVDEYNRMFKGRVLAINGWSAERILVKREHLFEEPAGNGPPGANN